MNRVRSGDAEIAYAVVGDGPPVIMLHPFPANHTLWLPVAQTLSARYRVLLPDLRAHGDSEAGEGPATMEKHATDLACILDDAGVGRAVFCGVSIGAYILFEFWRRHRGRVAGLVLGATRPQRDSTEGRAARLKTAAEVIDRGTDWFADLMIPKLLGPTTRDARPDRVDQVRRMILKMSPDDIAKVQQGMAERPDSVPTLKSIHVPTLILMGEEDALATAADGELMRNGISGSQLKTIARAGHYLPWEQPEEVGKLVRQFVDSLH